MLGMMLIGMPALGIDQSFSQETAGTFACFCGIHPGMTGLVVVEP